MNDTPFYERQLITLLDGTRVFKSPEDRRNERMVADQITPAWNCQLQHFTVFCPIDWYAHRYGRMIGLLELKSRTHASNTLPTVFLNVRKWLALQLAVIGLGVPALFVVKFTDQVRWCHVSEIHVGGLIADVSIGGCTRIVKSSSDIEPVIGVKVDGMRLLTQRPDNEVLIGQGGARYESRQE